MNSELSSPPSFWKTLRLLLGAARRRSAGRRKRQQDLLQSRSKGTSLNWGGLGFALGVLFMAALNVLAAFVLSSAVEAGQRVEAEHQGKIVVSSWFAGFAKAMAESSKQPGACVASEDRTYYCAPTEDDEIERNYSAEAARLAERQGGDKVAIEQKLRNAVTEHGAQDFITKDKASPGMKAISHTGPLPAMLGFLVLGWWGAMLVFQGEGLELDLQRRRHPMWEWLFSHPASPGAIFLAEMLSPIAANPIYWGGPLFPGVVYGFAYGPELGAVAAFLIGVPLTVAAACLGKAFETAVILRFPPRSRGAMIGLMSWMGYASMMVLFLGMFVVEKIATAGARFMVPFTVLPWPWLRLFLGGQANGSFSFPAGMLTCWLAAGSAIAAAIWFSVWGTQQGLSGNFSAADSVPSKSRAGSARFGTEPLYRKEFLWFIRDRSAIVQTILIPLTVAGVQVFNLRGLLGHAQSAWNYLCGIAILFGTYFLWILGPKSLTSEGTALWIALTWPRGLESLLKAKAWLWSLISSGLVALVLCYAVFIFPNDVWKIALVGVGWFLFGRSMAEKSVTLVTVTSSSGEPEKISWGRRYAAQLGMLTFSIGVLTQQWHLAIMGIVYSYITAAAMWQNFRARLPYLYDPWSEELPPPPTLMHAMVAISILVEGVAVVTALLFGLVAIGGAGVEDLAVVQAISYGICAVIVSLGVASFLSNRGVSSQDVWRWPAPAVLNNRSQRWWHGDGTGKQSLPLLLLLGAAGGLVLGLFAHGYLAVLHHLPATAEMLQKSEARMAKIPDLRLWYAVMAVGFAPFAEEYLFRGLLFRALDREWGGWRAMVGSAAFFAIYHPPLSWLPVALLGLTNAFLFKKTGRLAPAVVLHMAYNAVVLI